jgi:DNA-directed RNA polymerase specialized sigma24 family protein
MDLGTTPVDGDDIIQRHGRRLFVLAYHLTGDGPRAHELTQECLVRSLLEPAFPTGEREAAIHLIRGLVSLWRERLDPPARSGRPRGKVAAAPAPAIPSSERAALWSALSRLDPTSRAVLVLRVAGDLEYEAIGRILDMAADVVYARLLQARSRLRPGETALAEPVFEAMNLYLDGRLAGAERSEFERRLLTDAALRLRVEFHRGLTLELHEDAPPLPRDFAARIHDQLDRTRETLALVDQAVESAGWDPAVGPPVPVAPARSSWWRRAGGIAALVVAVAGITFWAARRLPVTPPAASSSEAPPASPSGSPSATPDEATIQALRSLGYLAPAPGRRPPRPAATPARPGTRPRTTPPAPAALPAPTALPPPAALPAPAATPGDTPVDPRPTPAPAASVPAVPAAPPAVEQPAASPPAAQPTASPEGEPAPGGSTAGGTVRWRTIRIGRAPEKDGQHRVVRTAAEWTALLDGSGAPVPEVAFDREMVVLLPKVLAVASVQQTAEAVVVECRQGPPPSGDEDPAAAASGLAVILPLSDQPVRIVIR